MLPLLLGKQPCLNFTVTFLFSSVAGIFELPVKNFAILLTVTIAFPEKKDINKINNTVSVFASREGKMACTTYYKWQTKVEFDYSNTHTPFFPTVIYFSNIKRAISFQINKCSLKIGKSIHDTILWSPAVNFFG